MYEVKNEAKMVHIGIFWMLGLFLLPFFMAVVFAAVRCCCNGIDLLLHLENLPDFSRDNRRLLAVGRACTFLELHHAGGAACFAI